MAFGKRQASARQQPGFASSDIEDRLATLRGEMRRIMREAAALVTTTTPVRADSKSDGPISLAGVSRHFTFQSGDTTKHCVYAYVTETPEQGVDLQAQMDLLALTTRIAGFNAACKGRSGLSLQHLLQDAEIRSTLDFIIARAAFFVAFFDNMLMAQPALTGTPIERARGVDYGRLKSNLEEWKARASGMMSDPSRLADGMPDLAWPIVGRELEVDDLPGQTVVDEIYLPPSMAAQVLAKSA